MTDPSPERHPKHEAEKDDDSRRRWILFFLLFLAVVIVVLIFVFETNSGHDDPQGLGAPTATVEPTPTEAATDRPDVPTPTPPVTTVDGQWAMTVDVTVATGVCAGEENDEPTAETVTFTQDGSTLSIVGLGYPADEQVWQGTIDGDVVMFTGERAEDDGTTTATFTLDVDFDALTMTGREDWSWTGPDGSCPDSASEVTATRIG